MSVLAQLMDIEQLERLSPEDLREMVLGLNKQIERSSGEKVLVSLEAQVVGVENDKPAGRGDPDILSRIRG